MCRDLNAIPAGLGFPFLELAFFFWNELSKFVMYMSNLGNSLVNVTYVSCQDTHAGDYSGPFRKE